MAKQSGIVLLGTLGAGVLLLGCSSGNSEGESNEGWAPYMDDLVAGLRRVHGSDFEVVDTGQVSTSGL
jgi:hypothetical protein